MNSEYFNSVNRYRYFYNIRPGDTLSKVILKIYQYRYGSDGYRHALDQIITDNPEIQHPDKVRIGQAISLRPLNSKPTPTSPVASQFAPNPVISNEDKAQFERTMKQMPQKQQDMFWALSWLEDAWGPASTGAGVTFASMGILLGDSSKGNIKKLAEIEEVYKKYKSGALTRGQYNYRRKKVLDTVAKNLGPVEKLLFKGKKAQESMRISRKGGVPATAALRSNTLRLEKLSKVASKGGSVLSVVNLGVACHQIANSASETKKNEILVETATSTAVGIFGGVAISVIVFATPVGWFGSLVLAAGTAMASSRMSDIGVDIYKRRYSDISVINELGIDKVCKQ